MAETNRRRNLGAFFKNIFGRKKATERGNGSEKIDFGVEETETLNHFSKPKPPRRRKGVKKTPSLKSSDTLDGFEVIKAETEKTMPKVSIETEKTLPKATLPLAKVLEMEKLKKSPPSEREDSTETEYIGEAEKEEEPLPEIPPLPLSTVLEMQSEESKALSTSSSSKTSNSAFDVVIIREKNSTSLYDLRQRNSASVAERKTQSLVQSQGV